MLRTDDYSTIEHNNLHDHSSNAYSDYYQPRLVVASVLVFYIM